MKTFYKVDQRFQKRYLSFAINYNILIVILKIISKIRNLVFLVELSTNCEPTLHSTKKLVPIQTGCKLVLYSYRDQL